MGHTPKIGIAELKKKGFLDEKRFFLLLSQENNYVDEAVVKDFYYGLVRVLTSELKKSGVVRLPELGDFALLKQKDSPRWAGKTRYIMKGGYALKFYAKDVWRAYFVKLAEQSGYAGALDPREKLLNKNI